MRLDRIIRDSGAEIICGSTSIEVSAICSDSRKVSFGSMEKLVAELKEAGATAELK